MIKFQYLGEGDTYIPHEVKVEVTLVNDEVLDQVMEAFNDFLLAVGFSEKSIDKLYSDMSGGEFDEQNDL